MNLVRKKGEKKEGKSELQKTREMSKKILGNGLSEKKKQVGLITLLRAEIFFVLRRKSTNIIFARFAVTVFGVNTIRVISD